MHDKYAAAFFIPRARLRYRHEKVCKMQMAIEEINQLHVTSPINDDRAHASLHGIMHEDGITHMVLPGYDT